MKVLSESSSPLAQGRFTFVLEGVSGPMPLSMEQTDTFLEGLRTLTLVSLGNQDWDVEAMQSDIDLDLLSQGDGTFQLTARLKDTRPWHERLLRPHSRETRARAQIVLHRSFELITAGTEMLPHLVLSDSVRVGTVADTDGLVPLVADGRRSVRVPESVLEVLAASPAARTAMEQAKVIFETDITALIHNRQLGSRGQRRQTLLDLPPGFLERVRTTTLASHVDRVRYVECPLEDLVTQLPRSSAGAEAPQHVGPPSSAPRPARSSAQLPSGPRL